MQISIHTLQRTLLLGIYADDDDEKTKYNFAERRFIT